MKKIYHREITIKALAGYFDEAALETIVVANLGQDAWRYQIGHDHFHYDASAFSAGDAYCDELRREIAAALHQAEVQQARTALGRLTHTVQDLYAHSNYVPLWRESHPKEAPDQIDPELPALLHDPRLRSGKLYYPLEAFSFFAALKPLVIPLLPHDSHAWMNIDDPSRTGFEYAYIAATKRTADEYMRIKARLSAQEVILFSGKDN